MREVELKHSRVAMLATVGLLAQEFGVVLSGAVSIKYWCGCKTLLTHPYKVFLNTTTMEYKTCCKYACNDSIRCVKIEV